ncbi:MAG: tetratricopeptide repeat protein [Bdellovibrionaceae bacterium]|nr:tetratricopeptide repeat protein [Pseudobdellovibrionaceae bacterium]
MKNRAIIILVATMSLILVHCSSKNKSSGNANVDASTEVPGTIIEESTSQSQRTVKRASQQPNPAPVTAIANTQRSSTPSSNAYGALNQHIKNQDEESILKEGSSLLMKNPNDTKAINAMAMSYYKRGQYPLAKNLLLRALKIDGSAYEVHSNLGVVQLAVGEKNEALKSFKKAIELNPNDYVSASNAGSLYVVEQDFDKASVVLEIAYSKGYRNTKVLSNYAIALTATGKYDKADKIYREALKENSNNKEVLFNHAILLIHFLKRNEEGLEIVKKLKFLGVPEEGRRRLQELEKIAEKK